MFISILKDVLNQNELARARDVLQKAKFVDGHVSGGDSGKNNLEMHSDSQEFVEVLKIVETALRANREFIFTAYPRYMTRPIISRYDTGMYYGEHTDFPIYNLLNTVQNSVFSRTLAPLGSNYLRTDLSLTLFINDPDTYDGGELCFTGQNGPERYKLPAGSAVLYPTGAPHSVSMVTRGSRLAAIFWIQSLMSLEPHRLAAYEAFQLMRSVQAALPGSRESQLAEINFHNILRLHSNV